MIEEGKFEEHELQKLYDKDVYDTLNKLKGSFKIRPFHSDIKGKIYDTTDKMVVGGYKVDEDNIMGGTVRDCDDIVVSGLSIKHSYKLYPYVGYNDDNNDPLYQAQLVYINDLNLYGAVDRNEDMYVINILGCPNSMIRFVNNVKILSQKKFIMELTPEEIRDIITKNIDVLYGRDSSEEMDKQEED